MEFSDATVSALDLKGRSDDPLGRLSVNSVNGAFERRFSAEVMQTLAFGKDLKTGTPIASTVHVNLLAWLMGQALGSVGLLLSAPTLMELEIQYRHHLEQISSGPPTDLSYSGPWGKHLLVDEDPDFAKDDDRLPIATSDDVERILVYDLVKRTDMRGTDVRVDSGCPYRFKCWPRMSVSPGSWNWKDVRCFRFKQKQHINELEMLALLHYVRWRSRKVTQFGVNIVVLIDNLVTISVAAKGRSSSKRLSRICSRLNAVCLASSLQLVLCYVRSADNPADKASRNKWSQ